MKRGSRHSYARRLLRANLRSFLRANALGTIAVAAILAISPVSAFFLSPPFTQGVTVGLMAVLFPGIVFFAFVIHTGGLHQVVGAFGEDNTHDELKKATKRGHIWGHIRNVELDHTDIDHIVIGPGRIFAIETKWHMRNADAGSLARDTFQAQRSARKAQSILRSKGIDHPHDVVPLVIVWGAGRFDVPEGGAVVDGVQVLRGTELADWLSGWRTGTLAEDNAIALIDRLEAFARHHGRAKTLPARNSTRASHVA